MPRDNSVSDLEDIEKTIKGSIKDVEKTMSKVAQEQKKTASDILHDQEKTEKKLNEQKTNISKAINDTILETEKKRAESQTKSAEQAGEIQKKKSKESAAEFSKGIARSLDQGLSNIASKYNSLLSDYTAQQQKLAFNIAGTGLNYDQIRDSLSALSTSTYIRQREVYQNLTNLVSSGIQLNVQQRAFLQTATDQVGLAFNSLDSNLNRLIQLQNMDLSEARIAQMAGLKTFLEQNYKNSQYIKDGFSQVSNSLFEMQSLMGAQMAMTTEKTIQTYLGSFRSAGGSTSSATSIAEALGKIGSGDFSSLGEGMQNLMVMAASRAGLSYADLLMGGLDSSKSEALLTSLLSYVANMSNMGGGSNVAMNAVAKMFGVTVSDIRAAQQMNVSGIRVSDVSSDISDFLMNLASSTNKSTEASILFENLISNRALYGDLVSHQLSQGIAGLFSGIPIVGPLIASLPDLGVLSGVIQDAASDFSGADFITALKDSFSGFNILDNLVGNGLIGGLAKTMDDASGNLIKALLSGIGGGNDERYKQLLSDYYWFDTDNSLYTSSGTFSAADSSASNAGSRTGETTSGKSTSNTGNNAQQTANSVKITNQSEANERSTEDLYNVLTDSNSTPYMTISNIVESNNAILIGNEEITSTIVDSLTATATYTQSIYFLLEAWAESSGNVSNEISRFREAVGSLSDNSALLYGDWAGSGSRR